MTWRCEECNAVTDGDNAASIVHSPYCEFVWRRVVNGSATFAAVRDPPPFEAIARELAESDPWGYDEECGFWCLYCKISGEPKPEQHRDACLWLRARKAVGM